MPPFQAKQTRYRCFMTPLADIDTNTYADEIDVSDRVEISGIGSIKRSLDSTDYNLGLFVFQDVTVKGFNLNGYFNDETDRRSIFKDTRDLCKVRIVLEEILISRDSNNVITGISTLNTSMFHGLINEEGTKIDVENDAISFKILSRDSVFRTTRVAGGVVSDGMTVKAAIEAILNDTKIASVLTFLTSDINPDLSFIIDNGAAYDNVPSNEALNDLLLLSNSILYTTDAGAIIVRDRTEDTLNPILNLFGKSDLLGRENIVGIKNYNLGIHRTFTSFKFGTIEKLDEPSVMTYGYRQMELTSEAVTDPIKKQQIAQRLLDEFKVPRIELQVEVPTRIAKNSQLLDRVSINYPLRVRPIDGKFLPIVGAAVIGDPDTPLPYTFGSVMIPPNWGFKIIEIEGKPKDFTTVLKLRQINDLVFNAPGNCIVGFAVIGEAIICEGGDPCDAYNPSVIGAAKIGCTRISA